MWKVIQNYLLTNTKEESKNIEMKNPCLKAGSSVMKKGSQKEAENEAAEDSDDSRLRDSTQAIEQRNSQTKEARSQEEAENEDSEDSEDSRWGDSTQAIEQRNAQIRKAENNESLKSLKSLKTPLHCYRSCKKYTNNCSNPTKCRQLGREKKAAQSNN